jgi:tetratricopeptide (TPR) repeat protein
MIRKTALAPLALALALAACSPPPAAPATAKIEAPRRDLVAEVRAVAANEASALEVQPLRDPQVEDLRASATRNENMRKYKEADADIGRALAITPDDPELLQHRAEIALARAEYELAEKLANSSYERGPKLGGLCRRNWATIRLSREMRGNAQGAATAGTQGQRCTVEPPVRM